MLVNQRNKYNQKRTRKLSYCFLNKLNKKKNPSLSTSRLQTKNTVNTAPLLVDLTKKNYECAISRNNV